MRHQRDTLPIDSRALRRTFPCTLLRPAGRRPEAVLYLLHGGHSAANDWVERMDLQAMVAPWPWAIALPEGDASLWIYGDDGQDYARYAGTEVPEAVESHLGLRLARNRRAVAGISMGGFGAFHLALEAPSRYLAAGALSGAWGMTWWNIGRAEPFVRALGPPGSATRARVDPWRTLERALSTVGKNGLPFLWFSTGTEDDVDVTLAHRNLHQALESAGVPHLARERPGGHDWGFWERETPPLLTGLAEALGLANG